MRFTQTLAAIVCVALLCGCGAIKDMILRSNKSAALLVGGAQAAASKAPIGIEEERAYGGAIAIKVVQKYGGLVEDEALTRYVGLVGNSVAAFSDRPNIRYHFGVLKSEGINAVSSPGGYVFITVGALRKMKSEAELAGVLAHEVSHITARHALEILKNLKAKSAMVGAAANTIDNPDFFKGIVNAFLDDFLARGLPQDTEFEADMLGTKLLISTGYDPNGLKDFLAGMVVPHGDSHDPFYDTHPDTSVRVKKLELQIKASGATGQNHAERMKKLMKLPELVKADPKTPPVSGAD